jgi:hypothetical protein
VDSTSFLKWYQLGDITDMNTISKQMYMAVPKRRTYSKYEIKNTNKHFHTLHTTTW